MAQYLAANNAATTTSGSITATDTAIPVTDGSAFPSPTGGAYSLVTLEDALGVREIVCMVGRSGNVITVGIPGSASANVLGRNYESILGMAAAAWSSGSIISCRPTADLIASGKNASDAAFVANTPAGNLIATTVQAALNELDTEKAKLAGDVAQVFNMAAATAVEHGVNKAFLSAYFPAGLISLWSGAVAAIPAGWALCDGTNGTPNLVDRFIVGAGSTYAVGATGGEATHVLTTAEMPVHSHANTLTDPGHSHTIQPSTQGSGGSAGSQGCFWTGANTSTNTTGITINNVNAGSGDAHENRPPYYALAYVMKL